MPAYEFTVEGNKLAYQINDNHMFSCRIATGEEVTAETFTALKAAVANKVEKVTQEIAKARPMPVRWREYSLKDREWRKGHVLKIHARTQNPIVRVEGQSSLVEMTRRDMFVCMSDTDLEQFIALGNAVSAATQARDEFGARFLVDSRKIAERFQAFQLETEESKGEEKHA